MRKMNSLGEKEAKVLYLTMCKAYCHNHPEIGISVYGNSENIAKIWQDT
jgi:hypothetical protein